MVANMKKKQSVQLLTISDQNEVYYCEYCKVTINTISKQIFVEPYDESIKMIQASFDWIFAKDENILFAKSLDKTIQFVLIFKTPVTTKKIVDVIAKHKPQKIGNQKMLFIDDILVPAVLEKSNTIVKEIFLKYFKFCHGRKKEKYLKIINDTNSLAKNNKNRYHNLRKRPFHVAEGNIHENSDKTVRPIKKRSKVKHQIEQSAVVRCYNFKLIKCKEQDEVNEKLFIFDDQEQSFGYSYRWDNNMQKFKCLLCRYKKYISTAVLKKDKEGKAFCEVGIHTCYSKKFSRIKDYEKRRKIYKPDYRIVEGYKFEKLKQRLIIFDPTNTELCYEYYPKGNRLYCAGCMAAENRRVGAQLYYNGTEKEFVEVYSDEHVCELRPYNPEKFIAEQRIVKKPDYKCETEIWQGKQREMLIVFVSGNQELCYKYYPSCTSYTCVECKKINHSVTAVLVKNDNQEEYVRLSPNQHICEPQLCVNEMIYDGYKFKILKQNRSNVIFVFNGDDESSGYKYLHFNKGRRYFCHGCYQKTGKKENFVLLKTNKDGEKYLSATAQQKRQHSCKPIEFDVVANKENIVNHGNYIFAVKNQNAKVKELIVFTSEDKTLCYNYWYLTPYEMFKCKACYKMGKTSSARISTDLNGEECIKLGVVKHVCKPIKYSVLKPSITKFLKSDDFPKNQNGEKKKSEGTERKMSEKIVELPNFKLLPDQNEAKDSILKIQYKNDETLFYQYSYRKSSNNYACINCQKQKSIATAKLCKYSIGTPYVILGINEHVCEPQKEEEKFTNYLIFDKDDENKQTKLVVFTSLERTLCYEYFQPKGRIKFSCKRCQKLKTTRIAIVKKDENGAEYVELDEREHVCEPVLFNRSKYEENPTIPESQFLIFPNSNGAPNKRLIIFHPNNYKLGYDCNKGDSYICHACKTKGHSFTAKLSKTKTNENCLEILQNGHVCEPKNLIIEKRIYYLPNYKLINDEKSNQMIILNHPTDKKLRFKFAYDNELEAFCCIQCRKEKNKIIAAKIVKTNTNEEVVVLAYSHYCEPFRQ